MGGRGRAAGVPILTTTELLWAILQSAANTIISLLDERDLRNHFARQSWFAGGAQGISVAAGVVRLPGA